MTLAQLLKLVNDLGSDRIERTTSFSEDKLGPAVCALSNDFPNHRQVGYILMGVNDNGTLAGMKIGDPELQKIGNIKSNGNVLPQPSLSASSVFHLDGGDVVVVEVKPSLYPPVRFDGRCWIRIGPRKSKATLEEERILTERRISFARTYDLVPALGATITDMDIELFKSSYLPLAIDKDTLAENNRTIENQLASLRFFDLKEACPTNAGILLFGLNPEFYLPGAYLHYVKFLGEEMTSDVQFEKKFSGPLVTALKQLDDFIKLNIIQAEYYKRTSA